MIEHLEAAAQDLAALAGEHGDTAAVAEAFGLALRMFAHRYSAREDAHPPAFRFEVAFLLGIAYSRRAKRL